MTTLAAAAVFRAASHAGDNGSLTDVLLLWDAVAK